MTFRNSFAAIFSCVALAGLATAPASAFEPSSDAEKKLVEWLEANSCAMTQDEFMDKALSGSGIPGSDLMSARRAMTKSGVIRKGEGNSMTLTAGAACGGIEVAEPTFDSGSEKDKLIKQLMGVFENNGCVLTERQAKDLAAADGMSRDQMDIAGEALDDSGGFTESDAGLQLTIGKCKNFVAKAPEGDDKTRVMAMFEQNGCSLMEDDLPDVAQQFQVTRKQFKAVTRPMKDADAFAEDGDKITLLVGDICGSKDASVETVVDTASEEPSEAELKERLVAVFENNGCVLDEPDATRLGVAAGLTERQINTAGEALYKDGGFADADGGLRLIIGKCEDVAVKEEGVETATEDMTVDQQIGSIFLAENCKVTESTFEDAVERLGYDRDALEERIDVMLEAGDITYDKSTRQATLNTGPCEGYDHSVASKSSGGDKRANLIALFEQNDCRLNEESATKLFPTIGMDIENDDDMALIEQMFDAGVIVEGDGDEAILVTGDICAKGTDSAAIREFIITAFADSDCLLSSNEFDGLMADNGIDSDIAEGIVMKMIDDGDATYDRDTKKAKLLIGACAK